MMVRLVSCYVRECRQALIDPERETEASQTRKEGRTIVIQNTYVEGPLALPAEDTLALVDVLARRRASRI